MASSAMMSWDLPWPLKTPVLIERMRERETDDVLAWINLDKSCRFYLRTTLWSGFIPPSPVAKCPSRLSVGRPSSLESALHFLHLYTDVCVYTCLYTCVWETLSWQEHLQVRWGSPSFPAGFLQSVHHLLRVWRGKKWEWPCSRRGWGGGGPVFLSGIQAGM